MITNEAPSELQVTDVQDGLDDFVAGQGDREAAAVAGALRWALTGEVTEAFARWLEEGQRGH